MENVDLMDLLAERRFDERLLPIYWKNKSTSIQYFESCLYKRHMDLYMLEEKKVLICKPGQVLLLPHRYFIPNTRDGSKIVGAFMVGQVVEDAAPKSLTHG